MRRPLSISSLRKVPHEIGSSGTCDKLNIQTIVEDTPRSKAKEPPANRWLRFLTSLAEGTIFLQNSDVLSKPANHLASTSSEYWMLIQECESD
ncbi:hypothetical protein BH09BAC3_BH09BAC3_10790 [soil metagenome]